uniref:WD_REPEATS_REGION domain-containing protein n=1 Tax=Macrostomum lignano TaxID=282301 RepID=A0A1I8FR64_9PLAT
LAWSDTLEWLRDVSLRGAADAGRFLQAAARRPSLLAVGDERRRRPADGITGAASRLRPVDGLAGGIGMPFLMCQWLADSADSCWTASGDKTSGLHSCLDPSRDFAPSMATRASGERASAVGQASGGQWRPVCSSASRDGTRVELWDSRTPGGSVGVIPDAQRAVALLIQQRQQSAASRRCGSSSTAVGEVMRPSGQQWRRWRRQQRHLRGVHRLEQSGHLRRRPTASSNCGDIRALSQPQDRALDASTPSFVRVGVPKR